MPRFKGFAVLLTVLACAAGCGHAYDVSLHSSYPEAVDLFAGARQMGTVGPSGDIAIKSGFYESTTELTIRSRQGKVLAQYTPNSVQKANWKRSQRVVLSFDGRTITALGAAG